MDVFVKFELFSRFRFPLVTFFLPLLWGTSAFSGFEKTDDLGDFSSLLSFKFSLLEVCEFPFNSELTSGELARRIISAKGSIVDEPVTQKLPKYGDIE